MSLISARILQIVSAAIWVFSTVAYSQQNIQAGNAVPQDAKVHFIGLKDGDTISTKQIIRFGAENVKIVSATMKTPGSGHHHLLIDTGLPPLELPIPSDFNHLHFGKGQTETVLSLPPGEHTLQLLLGDHEHRSFNPPVISEVVHVRVEQNTKQPHEDAPTETRPRVFFIGLKDGDTISTKQTIRFGAEKVKIVSATMKTPGSGHHYLLIDTGLPPLELPIPSDFNHIHFGEGQTETVLSLPPGEHTLQLLLGDHEHLSFDPPIVSQQIHIHVVDTSAGKSLVDSAHLASYFLYPHNDSVISSHLIARFDLHALSNSVPDKAHVGNSYLFVDSDIPPREKEVSADSNHIRLLSGETKRKLSLTPGEHRLQLVLTDEKNSPYDPPVASDSINIKVKSVRNVAEVKSVRNVAEVKTHRHVRSLRHSPPRAHPQFTFWDWLQHLSKGKQYHHGRH